MRRKDGTLAMRSATPSDNSSGEVGLGDQLPAVLG